MNFPRIEAAGLGEDFGVAGGDGMASGEGVLRDGRVVSAVGMFFETMLREQADSPT